MIVERRRRHAHERALLAQDRSVQRLELGPRLDPELVDERPAGVVVGGERVSLATRAIEGEHQLRPQALPQGVPAHERLDLGRKLRVDADFEIRRDPVFEHAQAKILQPVDLRLREVLELRVGERRSPPERERLAQDNRSLRRLERARLPGESLEADQVELVAVELEHVARRPCVQEARPEQLP